MWIENKQKKMQEKTMNTVPSFLCLHYIHIFDECIVVRRIDFSILCRLIVSSNVFSCKYPASPADGVVAAGNTTPEHFNCHFWIECLGVSESTASVCQPLKWCARDRERIIVICHTLSHTTVTNLCIVKCFVAEIVHQNKSLVKIWFFSIKIATKMEMFLCQS